MFKHIASLLLSLAVTLGIAWFAMEAYQARVTRTMEAMTAVSTKQIETIEKIQEQRPVHVWRTVRGRPMEACLGESRGTFDNAYVRCREGWQEYVRVYHDGREQVMRERAIGSGR